MDHKTCPRCRTRIPADAGLRCPKCGVRPQVGIVAASRARPISTAIAEGLPDVATQPQETPSSELDRLTMQSRRIEAGDPADEAECRRIGWWLMALRLLPFIVGALLLLLVPAAVFATFTQLDLETVGLRNLLILSALIVGPLSLGAGLVWLLVRRSAQDDEDASC